MPQIDLSCMPCCVMSCESCFPDGQPSVLVATITDATGDFAFADNDSHELGSVGDFDWVAEDVDLCCFGSFEIVCVGGVFYLKINNDCIEAGQIPASTTSCSPLLLTFNVVVDYPGCVGSFTLTVTV